MEVHEYGPGGKLNADRHYDAGSLITLDLMLAAPGRDFTGGDLVTPEVDGTLAAPTFEEGDAVLFVSHKLHNVLPVTSGYGQHAVANDCWCGTNALQPPFFFF